MEKEIPVMEYIKTETTKCRHKFTICRLCLCESEGFFDIFQVNECFGYVVAEVIRDLLQFQVSEMDGYPHVVCSICLGKLTDFKQFKEKCQDSRDIYNIVFPSDESDGEHPIDIEHSASLKTEVEQGASDSDASTETVLAPASPEEDETTTGDIPPEEHSASLKTEVEQGTNDVDATTEVELMPLKFEPEDPLVDIQERQKEKHSASLKTEVEQGTNDVDATTEADLAPASPEEEETTSDDIPPEMRECSVALTRLDYLAFLRKRAGCESYGTNENGSSSVNDGGNPLSTGRKKIAVDADPCENVKSSGSADVKVGKMDINERSDCKSPGDINRLESSVQDLRRELIERREEVNCCTTRMDEDEVFTLKLESSSESDGESERGEEAPLGVTEREKEYFRFNDCGQEFDKKEALIRHLDGHGYVVNMENSSEERDLQADTNGNCGSKRNMNEVRNKGLKRKLSDKVKRVKGVRKYVCDLCGQGFNCMSHMKVHIRIHTGEKPFSCTICGKQFNLKSNLKRHKLCHTGVKPYGCEVCGRYFADKSVLINHGRIHTGVKPHGCEVCGRYFARKSVLINHGRIHTGEKPYTCQICFKGFAQKVNLMTHSRIHSGEKSYKCEECKKRYNLRSSLRKHLRIHSQEKPHA